MRISIKTFGCRLNQAESARYAAEFAARGWGVAAFGKPVDVVLLHACAVTQTAESEVLRTARKLRETAFVVIAGCVAPEALPRAKEAAHLLVADKKNLAQIITDAWRAGLRRNARLACPSRGSSEPRPPTVFPVFTTSRAWLKVQDGCDCRCAYCIVPDTRGAPRSRSLAECLAEAAALFNAGHRELVVTGCNLARWGEGRLRLPELLAALADATPPGARLRVGSIEPARVGDAAALGREVVDVLAQHPVFCRFLHFPLQHADPALLHAMRRCCAIGEYRALLEYARKKIPGVALGADVITGFPGEDAAAFGALREFIVQNPFANLHVFPYSERPGTPAAAMPNTVPHTVRKARARELIALGSWQRAAFATTQVGVPQRVLVERVVSGVGTGWTDTYLACRVSNTTPAQRDTLVDFTPSSVDADSVLDG